MKNQIGVNLLTDNIPKDLLIGIPEEEYIRYKQQEEELENLRKIEKEHQKLNGELREEIKRLNNIINNLLDRQNEALRYIKNHLSLDSRYKHGNGDEELILVRKILNKHIKELKGSDK